MSSDPIYASHSLAVLADKDGKIISAVRSEEKGASKGSASPRVGIAPTNNQVVHNLTFSSEQEMIATLGEIGQYRLRHEGGQPTLSRLDK